MGKTIIIRSLLGSAQVETGILCLGSLLRNCQDDLQLILHDDGTLTDRDVEKLQEGLGKIEVVSRKTADEKMIPLLRKYPACLDYRKQHALGLKLLDICVFAEKEEPLVFCDSDVLFLRKFRLPKMVERGSAIFMEDSGQALSLRPWHVKPLGPLRVIKHLNSGWIMVNAEEVDLDFIESILGNSKLKKVFQKRPQWVEQTCWAALAAKWKTSFLLPSQVFVAFEGMGSVTREQVAIHFVSSHRGKLPRYLEQCEPNEIEIHQIGLRSARMASIIDLLNGEIAARNDKKVLLASWAQGNKRVADEETR